MCVTTDTSIGKWKYWGWLKDVVKDGSVPADPENDQGGDEEPVAVAEYATVHGIQPHGRGEVNGRRGELSVL